VNRSDGAFCEIQTKSIFEAPARFFCAHIRFNVNPPPTLLDGGFAAVQFVGRRASQIDRAVLGREFESRTDAIVQISLGSIRVAIVVSALSRGDNRMAGHPRQDRKPEPPFRFNRNGKKAPACLRR
jgi:hypothetical protein